MPLLLRIGLLYDSRFGFARDEVRGVIRYARERRLPWLFAGGPDSVATRAMLRRWRPDGLVVEMGANRGMRGVPVVSPLDSHPTGAVTLDNAAIGSTAALHFVERGFRNMAFVGERDQAWSDERGRGFTAESERAGTRCRRLDVSMSGDVLWSPGAARLSAWLADLPRPTGLMASRDLVALEVIHTARNLGLRVPEDVAVIGVDNDELVCELADPPLSSIAVPWERVGYHMGAHLECLMHGDRPAQPLPRIGPGQVIARQSSDTYAVTDTAVIRAGAFLREHAAHHIGVADVALAAGVSRRSLERRFRRALGRSPLAELRCLRLDRVRAMLRDPALTLAYIASRTGFRNGQRLSTVFRKYAGQTPGTYRTSLRFGNL